MLPVLPRYVHGPLDGGNIAVGVVIGSYAITGLLLRPVAGRLADRRGRKPTVLVGSLLVAVAGFLYLLPLGIAGLIVARLVLGAGEGTVFTAGSAWIVDLAPARPPRPRDRPLRPRGLGRAQRRPADRRAAPARLRLHRRSGSSPGRRRWSGRLIALAAAGPLPPRARAEHEHQPLIAREAVRPGRARSRSASIGYATVAAFVVLHLDARGVGHGATVFGAFATMVVLTRLRRRRPARPGRPGAGGDRPRRWSRRSGWLTIGIAHSLPVALAGALAMGAAFSLLYPSLSLIVVDRVPETRRGAALGTFTAFFDAGVGIGARHRVGGGLGRVRRLGHGPAVARLGGLPGGGPEPRGTPRGSGTVDLEAVVEAGQLLAGRGARPAGAGARLPRAAPLGARLRRGLHPGGREGGRRPAAGRPGALSEDGGERPRPGADFTAAALLPRWEALLFETIPALAPPRWSRRVPLSLRAAGRWLGRTAALRPAR